jgi:Protein of unknown function (DUF429)
MTSCALGPLLPRALGLQSEGQYLCIGLDMAWFGGSKGRPDSQHDCLVWSVSDPQAKVVELCINTVKLVDRDPDAEQIFCEIKSVIEKCGEPLNVVLAIDAPLQGVRAVPNGRQKVRRFCEERLSAGRQAIDREMGGARGWHPTIQPGIPLAPRVQKLMAKLENQLNMQCWSPELAAPSRLIIECFPAEAIWAAKRLGGYSLHPTGDAVKAYKKQQGKILSATEIESFVTGVLLNSFEQITGMPDLWPVMVRSLISQMLRREDWGSKDGRFRGGKFLDDVVDSALCLAAALSYANGKAHVWYDPENADDGHIIGPGQMHELQRERTGWICQQQPHKIQSKLT